MKSTTSTRW